MNKDKDKTKTIFHWKAGWIIPLSSNTLNLTQSVPKWIILISIPAIDANNHMTVWSDLFSLFESMVTPMSHFVLYQNCMGTRRPQNIHQAKTSPLPRNKLTKNTIDIFQQNFWPRSESPLLSFFFFFSFFQCLSCYSSEGGWLQQEPSTRFWF